MWGFTFRSAFEDLLTYEEAFQIPTKLKVLPNGRNVYNHHKDGNIQAIRFKSPTERECIVKCLKVIRNISVGEAKNENEINTYLFEVETSFINKYPELFI